MTTRFRQLNEGWNAEPNAPEPIVEVDGDEVVLSFLANAFQFKSYIEGQRLRLRFPNARRYRLGATNDEGWYRGQCRFSDAAPAWGEFYEVSGDLRLDRDPGDWRAVGIARPPGRHFLFYLRDETFECEADAWALDTSGRQPWQRGRLHFVDTNPDVVHELRLAFEGADDVACSEGDVLSVARNALVSPANSYGFMDGGIDAAYSAFFGPRLQATVQEAINRRPEGYLPVGASLAVPTGHARIPFLIVAPTMHTPEEVPSENCYRAMRAVLRLMTAEAAIGREVFCPGLATGTGHVPPAEAAKQMFRAYADWKRP
jgi:O-acetyl-ADP-ribose deacetylase (regulator of RNase III)